MNYLSKKIQNEFISLISCWVNENILSSYLQKDTYYSVILVYTPDKNQKDKWNVSLVYLCSVDVWYWRRCRCEKHFLQFFEASDISGERLTVCFLDKLSKREMPLKICMVKGMMTSLKWRGNMSVFIFKREYLNKIHELSSYLVEATHNILLSEKQPLPACSCKLFQQCSRNKLFKKNNFVLIYGLY